MASIFGLPVDAISNLSDSSEHLLRNETLNEKMVFVGGRYSEKHRDVFRLFFWNITDETQISQQTYVMLNMFVLMISTVIICTVTPAVKVTTCSTAER